MRVKLNKALYELRKAPKIWIDTIKAFFLMHGFTQSTLDECLFFKRYLDKTSTDVILHVDDGKGTTDTPERARNLLIAVKQQFKHNYLSIVFNCNREKRTVKIPMNICYETPGRGNSLSPHTSALFKVQEAVKLKREEQ